LKKRRRREKIDLKSKMNIFGIFGKMRLLYHGDLKIALKLLPLQREIFQHMLSLMLPLKNISFQKKKKKMLTSLMAQKSLTTSPLKNLRL